MNTEIKDLFNKIESLDWKVEEEEENIYRLSKYSTAGQDFSIQVEGENADELVNSTYVAYSNFDVSEEAYLWLDNTGHGKNGAPHEMKDVLEDMEECHQMILDLHNELSK